MTFQAHDLHVLDGGDARPAELWYSSDDGRTYVPTEEDFRVLAPPPAGFDYQHARFSRSVREGVLHLVRGEDGSVERSEQLFSGESSYPSDLVLALCRPTARERLSQFLRYGRLLPRYRHDAAVCLALSCERCMNALAHRAGLLWGYRRGSEKWTRLNTRCGLCESGKDWP